MAVNNNIQLLRAINTAVTAGALTGSIIHIMHLASLSIPKLKTFMDLYSRENSTYIETLSLSFAVSYPLAQGLLGYPGRLIDQLSFSNLLYPITPSFIGGFKMASFAFPLVLDQSAELIKQCIEWISPPREDPAS